LEHRPELARLLDELSNVRAQYVIVGDVARLSRNARELVVVERRLMEVSAELLVWGENEVHAHLRRRMAALLAGVPAHEHAERKEGGA
jgi:DNA invertase Pin-like site-specific DNA recombinase